MPRSTWLPERRRLAVRWRQCDGGLCLGFLHAHEPEEIQRCDECARFDLDEHAQLAHTRECGCGWGALARTVAECDPLAVCDSGCECRDE